MVTRRFLATIAAILTLSMVAAFTPEVRPSSAAAKAKSLPCTHPCLLNVGGKGTGSLKKVALPRRFTLMWSFRCSSSSRFTVQFYPYVRAGQTGTSAYKLTDKARAKTGRATVHLSKGGNYLLKVAAPRTCSWALQARGLPTTTVPAATATDTPIATSTPVPTNTATPYPTAPPQPTSTPRPRFDAGTGNASDGTQARFTYLADTDTGIEALLQYIWGDGSRIRRQYTDGFDLHPPAGSAFLIFGVAEINYVGAERYFASPLNFELRSSSGAVYEWRPAGPDHGYPSENLDNKGDTAAGLIGFEVPDKPDSYTLLWNERGAISFTAVGVFSVQ